MSTKSKAKDAEATEEGAEAKGGGRKKLLLVGFAVVAVAAAAVWFLFLSGGSAEAEAPVPGAVLPLEPVAVNLAGGGYLKVGVALQLVEGAGGGKKGPGVDGSKALDLIISTYSQAQPGDVTGARDALKESLEQRIVEAYEDDVIGIYFTEYVTQ